MEFFSRAAGKPARLGILAGSFNPPTRAHLALASAGLAYVDEVVLVLPRLFPHKSYEGADFVQRAVMIRAALGSHPCLSAAANDGGLFADIATECHAIYGPDTQLAFLCGRDAAERIVNWDYGEPGAIERMLGTFHLLVASRQGSYEPPGPLRHRIRTLPISADLDAISASEVRRRIREGLDWEELVPETIVPMVREIYRPPA